MSRSNDLYGFEARRILVEMLMILVPEETLSIRVFEHAVYENRGLYQVQDLFTEIGEVIIRSYESS